MEWVNIGAVVGMAVAVIGGISGILSLVNQRRQTKVMQDQVQVMQHQLQMLARQEGSVEEWARKFDEAVGILIKIGPRNIPTGPGTAMQAYPGIFSSEDLKGRIERYLGHRRNFVRTFQPFSPTKEQLQNPVVQRTIQDVLDATAKFKVE